MSEESFRSSELRKLAKLKEGESAIVDLDRFTTAPGSLFAKWRKRLWPRRFVVTDLGHKFYEVKCTRETDFPSTKNADRGQLPALLDAIVEFLNHYIVLRAEAVAILALWVAHSWAIDSTWYTPYMHIFSAEKRCGKSRLIECLRLLVRLPWVVVSPTAAALFRKIDAETPTLFIDEIDAVFSNGLTRGNETLRAILNAGFEKGRTVPRCTAKGQVTESNVFCPKLLCGIGQLPTTVADRSVLIELLRRRPNEPVEAFRKEKVEPIAAAIRAKLEAWSQLAEVTSQLRALQPQIPPGLTDRQADISEPLLAIAELAGGTWPIRAAEALTNIFGDRREEESTGVKLLIAIRQIFDELQVDRISSEELIRRLVEVENGDPWPQLWERSAASGKFRAATTKLAQLLKPFGITPRVIRLSNGKTPRGYIQSDFEDSWQRYCPPKNATDATNATAQVLALE